jgi:hypothetical protein
VKLPANQYKSVPDSVPFKVSHKMAEVTTDAAAGTVTLNAYATIAMKDFFFGNKEGKEVTAPDYKDIAGNEIKKATAAYGIDGAISVLERELVLAEEAHHSQAWYDSVVVAKDSIYKAKRKILEDGFTNYKPYTDAKAAQTAVGDGGEAAFFAAVKKLYHELTEVNGDTELNYNDSTAVLGAIAQYAAARDKFFDDLDADGKPNEYGKGQNPKYFYMAVGENASGAILDSVLFSELLTQASKTTKIDAVYYEYDTAYKHRDKTSTDVATGIGGRDNTKVRGLDYALCNILNQLFTDYTFGDGIFTSGGAITLTLPVATTEILRPNNDYTIDDWEDPTEVTNPTNYVPQAVTDAADAVEAAKQDYIDVYEEYWGGMDYPGTPKDPSVKANQEQEIPVGTYVAETFTDPYQIVTFSGNNIKWTEGLGAILCFIDPMAGGPTKQSNDLKDSDNNLVPTAIFGTATARTPFAAYLKARQDAETHGALLPMKEALEKIKDWAEEVRTVFDTAIAKDGTDNVDAYNSWKSTYDTDKTKYFRG